MVLRFTTFSIRGEIRVCVSKRTRTCRTVRLHPIGGGLYHSGVYWSRRFPNEGHGSYRVRWLLGSNPIGVVISFRR